MYIYRGLSLYLQVASSNAAPRGQGTAGNTPSPLSPYAVATTAVRLHYCNTRTVARETLLRMRSDISQESPSRLFLRDASLLLTRSPSIKILQANEIFIIRAKSLEESKIDERYDTTKHHCT